MSKCQITKDELDSHARFVLSYDRSRRVVAVAQDLGGIRVVIHSSEDHHGSAVNAQLGDALTSAIHACENSLVLYFEDLGVEAGWICLVAWNDGDDDFIVRTAPGSEYVSEVERHGGRLTVTLGVL